MDFRLSISVLLVFLGKIVGFHTDLRLTLESLKKSANISTDLRLATEVSVDVC